jgi:hypothetical protein
MVAGTDYKNEMQERSCGDAVTILNTYQQSPLPCWQFSPTPKPKPCPVLSNASDYEIVIL